MSADGMLERDAIVAKLETITYKNAEILRGIPDEAHIARYSNGKVKPYGIIKFAGPIPTSRDRRIAIGEEDQPQILALMFIAYADTQTTAERLAGRATNALLGFKPGPGSSVLKSAGGYAFTTLNDIGVPARFQEAVSFQAYLNQGV